jgi:hypothetical protein
MSASSVVMLIREAWAWSCDRPNYWLNEKMVVSINRYCGTAPWKQINVWNRIRDSRITTLASAFWPSGSLREWWENWLLVLKDRGRDRWDILLAGVRDMIFLSEDWTCSLALFTTLAGKKNSLSQTRTFPVAPWGSSIPSTSFILLQCDDVQPAKTKPIFFRQDTQVWRTLQ